MACQLAIDTASERTGNTGPPKGTTRRRGHRCRGQGTSGSPQGNRPSSRPDGPRVRSFPRDHDAMRGSFPPGRTGPFAGGGSSCSSRRPRVGDSCSGCFTRKKPGASSHGIRVRTGAQHSRERSRTPRNPQSVARLPTPRGATDPQSQCRSDHPDVHTGGA